MRASIPSVNIAAIRRSIASLETQRAHHGFRSLAGSRSLSTVRTRDVPQLLCGVQTPDQALKIEMSRRAPFGAVESLDVNFTSAMAEDGSNEGLIPRRGGAGGRARRMLQPAPLPLGVHGALTGTPSLSTTNCIHALHDSMGLHQPSISGQGLL